MNRATLIVLLLLPHLVHGQYTANITPSPQPGEYLNNLHVAAYDTSLLFASRGDNTILRLRGAGAEWEAIQLPRNAYEEMVRTSPTPDPGKTHTRSPEIQLYPTPSTISAFVTQAERPGWVGFSHSRYGFFISKDEGTTWSLLSSSGPRETIRLIADPTRTDHLIALEKQGILLESEDGGQSWEPFGPDRVKQIEPIIDQAGLTLFIHRSNEGPDSIRFREYGLLKGDEYRVTARRDGPKDAANLERVALDTTTPGRVFIKYTQTDHDESSWSTLAVSDDYGAAWETIQTRGDATSGIEDLICDSSGTLWIVGKEGVRLLPRGSLSPISRPLSNPRVALGYYTSVADDFAGVALRSLHLLDSNGLRFLVNTNCGLARSEDGGETLWWPLDIPTTVGGFKQIIAPPNNPSVWYLASMSGFYRSTDRGENWLRTSLDPVLSMSVSPLQADFLLAWREYGKLHISRDGGLSWSASSGEIKVSPTSESLSSQRRVVYSPDESNLVVISPEWKGSYESTDFGKTWLKSDISRIVYIDKIRTVSLDGNSLSIWARADGKRTVHPTPGHPQWLFVYPDGSGRMIGMMEGEYPTSGWFRSPDWGQTWFLMEETPFTEHGWTREWNINVLSSPTGTGDLIVAIEKNGSIWKMDGETNAWERLTHPSIQFSGVHACTPDGALILRPRYPWDPYSVLENPLWE